MMRSYVREDDPEMRQKSNRTYERILRSLQEQVASQYSADERPARQPLYQELNLAVAAQDWQRVIEIATELSGGEEGQICEIL